MLRLERDRHAGSLLHSRARHTGWREGIKEGVEIPNRREPDLEARETRILALRDRAARERGSVERRRTVHASDSLGLLSIPPLDADTPTLVEIVLKQAEERIVLDVASIDARNRIGQQTQHLVSGAILAARADCRLTWEERVGRNRWQTEDIDRASRLSRLFLPVEIAQHEVRRTIEIRTEAQLLAELLRLVRVVELRRTQRGIHAVDDARIEVPIFLEGEVRVGDTRQRGHGAEVEIPVEHR